MSRLVTLYASNLLNMDAITAAGSNLDCLDLQDDCQLSDENLGVGSKTWALLADVESEFDIRPFFGAVRMFHVRI